MSEELNSLAAWTTRLIDASYDFREHCCEFSKFLVQDVPDDYWPDVADQLLRLLGDVDHIAQECVSLAEPFRSQLVKAVAELHLPKPDSHLSWTLWTIEHWQQIAWKIKLELRLAADFNPGDVDEWFFELGCAARQQPTNCKELSRLIISIGEDFKEFDDRSAIIERLTLECKGLHALGLTVELPSEVAIDRLSVKKWAELSVGIDEKQQVWCLSPSINIGAAFPKSKAEMLEVPNGQLRELLVALADSLDGCAISVSEAFSIFQLLPPSLAREKDRRAMPGEVDSAIQAEMLMEIRAAHSSLKDVLKELRRTFREHVHGPMGKLNLCFTIDKHDVRSAFVVRWLLATPERTYTFGAPR